MFQFLENSRSAFLFDVDSVSQQIDRVATLVIFPFLFYGEVDNYEKYLHFQ